MEKKEKINGKKRKKGKVGNKSEKKRWKKKKCTVDYYCNPQCIGCGWTVNSSHPLAFYLILNQLNIKKIKSTNIILKNKIEKPCGKTP